MDENLNSRFQETRKLLSDQIDSSSKKSIKLTQTFDIIRYFEQLGGIIYRMRRSAKPGDPRLAQAEDFVALASARLITRIKKRRGDRYSNWLARYRRVWRQNFDLFLVVTCIFIATGIVGWNLGATMPEYAAAIIPQEFMERIIQQNKWFEDLNDSPYLGGLQIAWHNMRVCFMTFIAGGLFGIGGLALIGYNGLHIGVVLGFCFANQFDGPLREFITGHGPLELSIIVCAGFASALFGRVFWMRPYKKFALRMKEGMREAGTVVTGVIPWLLLAGIVEGAISPNPDIPLKLKMLIGGLIAIIFWLWTWAPNLSNADLEAAEKIID